MPEWQADAIILSVRPHGEGNAVVSLLTSEYGRHAGLVRADWPGREGYDLARSGSGLQ